MSDEGRHGHPLPFAPMCWECWADKARILESQNQALQERLRLAEHGLKLLDKPEYVEALHAAGFEHLQDVLASHQALQERAEKAEAILETIVVAHAADLPVSHDAALTLARDYLAALSPTEETDPEHLHRFGEHGTCQCGATPGGDPE